MTAPKGPSLTDARGLGGIVAQDGFDYQIWDAITRVPAWIRSDAFEGVAIETLEDFEARFFAPHSSHRYVLDRFQAKSGALSRSELIEVFKSFSDFEVAYPSVARGYFLVTPTVPSTLSWIVRDPGRVRRARPFYSPFSQIQKSSDDKLRSDLTAEFGAALGELFATSIEVELHTALSRRNAEAAFVAAMGECFPNIDVPARKLLLAFNALTELFGRRGVLISRREIHSALVDALDEALVPIDVLHVHVRSDRNGPEAEAVEIDASRFSGNDPIYPVPTDWQTYLLAPLIATASWARSNARSRIVLTGSYRLSTAWAVGWSFRSAVGFDIEIQTRSGVWHTDEHPKSDGPSIPLQIGQAARTFGGRLKVGIGILRDPTMDIRNSLGLERADDMLSILSPNAITDGSQAQQLVKQIKLLISEAATRLRSNAIDVYYVGPAALAVAFGHRWNGLPPTQLFEFGAADGSYRASVEIT